MISVCYITIGVNLLVLIAVWYFFAFHEAGHDPVRYWISCIILPSFIMLIENVVADILVRSGRISLALKEYISIFLMLAFCSLLCMQHKIVAVLLASPTKEINGELFFKFKMCGTK